MLRTARFQLRRLDIAHCSLAACQRGAVSVGTATDTVGCDFALASARTRFNSVDSKMVGGFTLLAPRSAAIRRLCGTVAHHTAAWTSLGVSPGTVTAQRLLFSGGDASACNLPPRDGNADDVQPSAHDVVPDGPSAGLAAAANAADIDLPLQKLKTRYAKEWPMVEGRMPRWEVAWAPISADTIKRDIEHIGIDPLEATEMATLLRQHFDTPEDPAGWPRMATPFTSLEEVKSGKSDADSPLSWVTLSGGWLFEAESERMIRHNEYPLLWTRVKAAIKADGHVGLLIQGQPGIGKTLVLDLIAASLLVQYPSTPIIAVAITGVTVLCKAGNEEKRYALDHNHPTLSRTVQDVLQRLGVAQQQRVVVLHDVKTRVQLPFRGTLVGSLRRLFTVTCILASSPEANNYKDFDKMFSATTLTVHVLPVLSRREAKEFVSTVDPEPADPTDATYLPFDQRYAMVGGVPRNLRRTETVFAANEDQSKVVSRVQYDPARWQDTPLGQDSAKDPSHLITVIPTDDRRRIEAYDFVSSSARLKWVARQSLADERRLLGEFRSALVEGTTRRMLGQYFENWVIKLLHAPTFSLSCRILKQGTKAQRVQPFLEYHALAQDKQPQLHLFGKPFRDAVFGSLPSHTFDGQDFKGLQPADGLHVPLSENFPEFDAVLMSGTEAYLVQVTVRAEHRPKVGKGGTSTIEKLLNQLKAKKVKAKGLVFVVNTTSQLDRYQEWRGGTAKDLKELKQYLCHADDPTELAFVRRKRGNRSTVPVLSFYPRPDDEAKSEKKKQRNVLAAIKKHVDSKVTSVTSAGDGSPSMPWTYES